MSVSQVAPGVWRAGTRFVNWYLLDAGKDGVTLVDAGLPRYDRHLEAALTAIGRTIDDVSDVVLTHGHIDHIGLASKAASRGATVHLHPADAALAANPRRNRTDSSVLPYLRWPATVAFVAHCLAEGAARPRPMPATVPLREGPADTIAGRPGVTATPGHTEGSCVLEFPEHDVVFIGDLLCTVDPRTGARAAPQLQTRGSNRDSDQAMASLDRVGSIEARVVLPGHGDPWRDGLGAAIASARAIGCR